MFFFLIFLLLILLSKNNPCTIEDYGQYFSPCDLKTNTQNITIYLKSNCTYDNIQNDNESLLSIYSTLPSFNTTCNNICNSGEKKYYDIKEKKIICNKCPINTFSTSGDIIINGQWNKNDLNKFQTTCFSIDHEGIKENENCSKLTISKDKSMIMTGELLGKETYYLIEIMYFFNSKNPGRLILKYKKDSIIDNGFLNGELSIFFDFELIEINYEKDNNSEWKALYLDFDIGEHEIVFFYSYEKIENKMPLRFYITNFILIGLEDGIYECEKCINSVSPEGSDRCYSCDIKAYYDYNKKECVLCPQGEIFNENEKKCTKMINCNDFDYIIDSISECVHNKKNISFIPFENTYCNNKDELKRIITIDCLKEKDDENLCSEGMIYSNYFNYDFTGILLKDFFDENQGFNSNDKGIFTGNYLNHENEKVLRKKIIIGESGGSIKISFNLDLTNSEGFTIIIDSKTYFYTNLKKNISINEILSPGEIILEILYEKIEGFLKINNPVLITELIIYGSNLFHIKKFIKCPKGSISIDNCSKCFFCPENQVPDKMQKSCIECENGLIKHDFLCEKCPLYTYNYMSNCLLNEVILQSQDLLRFNLYPLKEYIQKICSDQSGILCYDNSFIGPVSLIDKNSSNNNNDKKDLFFISLFEPKNINIFDFDNDEKSNEIKKGFIFGLFTVKNHQTQININKLGMNLTNTNVKIKKNIASTIKKIEILPNSINANRKLGLFIEYNEGDICLSDHTKRYKSYLYLKCNKYEISSPKLLKVKDNNCTFIFEWPSPNICKNCVVKEIQSYDKGTCHYGKRPIIFNSDDDCLIFNISGTNLRGGEIEYNNSLCDQNCDLYDIIIGEKNKHRDNQIQTINPGDFNFNFDFIENTIYYQKCSFFENVSGKWIKYLFIIPVLYLITIIAILVYWFKYKKIKHEYEKLNYENSRNVSVRKNNSLNVQENNKTEESTN